jgi:integrase
MGRRQAPLLSTHRSQSSNPATWRDNLAHSLPKPGKVTKVKHRPALPWQDVREFMAALRQDNSVAARALEFTILTGARPGEIRLMPWSEVNLKNRTWEIPARRMKAERPHRVPLSDAAVEILTALKRDGTPGKRDYVFAEPTGRPLPEKALRRVCHSINPSISVHGMRSTFRDWIAANTKFPRELAELALAHAIKGSAEAVGQVQNAIASMPDPCRTAVLSGDYGSLNKDICRASGAIARLGIAMQQGALALQRLRQGARQTVRVEHVQVTQVAAGGQALVAGRVGGSGANGG